MYFIFSEKIAHEFFFYFFLKGEVVRGKNNGQEDEKNHRTKDGLQETEGIEDKLRKLIVLFC